MTRTLDEWKSLKERYQLRCGVEAKARMDAEERLADYENSVKHAMDEKCGEYQDHCSCVGLLRARVSALEGALREAVDPDPLKDNWLAIAIEKALNEYEPSYSGGEFRLVDQLTPDGDPSITRGKDEIEHLTEEIWCEVTARIDELLGGGE